MSREKPVWTWLRKGKRLQRSTSADRFSPENAHTDSADAWTNSPRPSSSAALGATVTPPRTRLPRRDRETAPHHPEEEDVSSNTVSNQLSFLSVNVEKNLLINKMSDRSQIPEFLIRAIPVFDGSANALCDFLDIITEIETTYITKNTNVESKRENTWLLYHLVKTKLNGTARDIVSSHQCRDLKAVIEILKSNFSDRKPVVTLISELWNIKSKSNQHPLEFLDFLNSKRNIIITKYRLENIDEKLLPALIEQLEKQLVLIYLKNISSSLAMQLECMRAHTLEECRVHLTQNCSVGLENSLKSKYANNNASYNKPHHPTPHANYENKYKTSTEKLHFSRPNASYANPENKYKPPMEKPHFSRPNNFRNNNGQKSTFVKREPTETKTHPLNLAECGSDTNSEGCNTTTETEVLLVEALKNLNSRLDRLEDNFLGQGPASNENMN
jgi:hypothetical protein